MRYLKIFWLLTIYSIRTSFQNGSSAAAFLFAKFFRFGVYFYFVYNIIKHSKVLAGYSLEETVLVLMTFTIVDTLAQLLFREVYRFRPLILSGDFDTILVKPYHPFLRILIGGIDILDAIFILAIGGLLIYLLFQAQVTAAGLFLYGALIINGLIIGTAFHITVLALGLLTAEIDNSIMLYRDIARAGTLPIDIYKQPIRSIITFIIPIGIMMTVPVKALFGKASLWLISISFLIGLLYLLLSLELWKKAINNYQSASS